MAQRDVYDGCVENFHEGARHHGHRDQPRVGRRMRRIGGWVRAHCSIGFLGSEPQVIFTPARVEMSFTRQICHSERSEEPASLPALTNGRFLAPLGMTIK